MKLPDLSVTPEKIDKLITRINSGDIRIPAFQRAYVWKQNQLLELLDSIIRNYPIGSILLWSTSTERLKHTRNIAGYEIPDNPLEYPVNYVLDGQQRLSSIYATFTDKTQQDPTTEKYNPNLDIFEIYYDFASKTFLTKADVSATSTSVVYLRNFLNGSKMIDALKTLDPAYHSEAQELYSKFINYEFPVVTVKNRTKDEVGIIFERINNTGTKLTTLDLMTAWTWTDDFHLIESIDDLLQELDEKNFGELTQNILLQSLSGVILNDTTTKAITSLSGVQVRDNWNLFCEAIRKTIDYLATELNCKHQDFLPHQQQIVALCKFFSLPQNATANQFQQLKKWFWKTSFSDRYSTGQTTSKMNVDIHTILSIRQNNFVELDKYKYTVTVPELIETKFSKGNPITRASLLLMAQNCPIDLVKNIKIDIATALSKYNRKQYHHVFPAAFLNQQKVPHDKIFNVLNFCFLPADSNRKISKKAPSDYFFSLIPPTEFQPILRSNLLPEEKELYKKDDYENFLIARGWLFLEEIQKITS